jgi:hypothetical protein
MTSAYGLAKQHLDAGVAEAKSLNIDSNTYGQALIWKVLEMYTESGRSFEDIASELEFTMENLDGEGIFHVIRN